MSMSGISARYTRIAASQSDSKIAAGEPVIIHGILISNPHTDTQAFTFEENGSTTVILTIDAPIKGSVFIPLSWFADKGMQVTTPGNGASCTVFHSHAGR
jgi:hypothetical protein